MVAAAIEDVRVFGDVLVRIGERRCTVVVDEIQQVALAAAVPIEQRVAGGEVDAIGGRILESRDTGCA